jgi:hypothetical protein
MREFHPAAAIFELLEGEDLDNLVADIEKHGLLTPTRLGKLYTYEDFIKDGFSDRDILAALVNHGADPGSPIEEIVHKAAASLAVATDPTPF